MMGGAVRTQGNVEHAGHDGTAEWNIFNNPKAAQTVIESGIKITMVPLDATNKVPLTRTFLDSLKAQEKYASSRLLFEAWNLAATYIDQGTYYFWDTLTSASILKPDLIKTERMRIKVVVNGPSQGRMVESSDGHWVDVAVDADRRAVEELFLTMLKK